MCAIQIGADSSYETDVFTPLIERIQSLTGDDTITLDRRPAYRAVADHARAMTFLIADGILPSNEGRGYVLRRILRRASYQGRSIGLDRPFLSDICRVVIDAMSEPYPEVRQSEQTILNLVSDEEVRFLETLDSGLQRLDARLDAGVMIAGAKTLAGEMEGNATLPEEHALSEQGKGSESIEVEKYNQKGRLTEVLKILPGDEAFRLYDTYGFPIDLTRKVLEARGWSVDEEGFDKALEEQRERGREAHGEGKERENELLAATRDLPATDFVGYDTMETECCALLAFGEGETIDIVLDIRPFYAEGGGQVGDHGKIVGPNGEAQIESVRRLGGVFVHSGRTVHGQIATDDRVRAEVDRGFPARDDAQSHRDAPAAQGASCRVGAAGEAGRLTCRAGPAALRLCARQAADRR